MKRVHWPEYIKQHSKNIQEDKEPIWSSAFFNRYKEGLHPSKIKSYSIMDEDENKCRCVVQ